LSTFITLQTIDEHRAAFENIFPCHSAGDIHLMLFVKFILDVTDHFFDHIFHRHDTRRTTIFITTIAMCNRSR
jgi:hypothetical protein